MRVVAIIPARGGSKRIPQKNIKEINGKPLIAYSIEHAKSAKNVDRVIVSTDDEKIASIAKEYGAEVIMRPEELAQDNSPTEPCLQHVVKELEKEGYIAELVVLLQCTSPIRYADDVEKAVNKMIDTESDSLVSVRPFNYFFWKRKKEEEFEPINYDPKNRPRSQDWEQFLENGSLYITKTEILMNDNCRLGGKMTVYEMDDWTSLEIDTLDELNMIEMTMKYLVEKGKI